MPGLSLGDEFPNFEVCFCDAPGSFVSLGPSHPSPPPHWEHAAPNNFMRQPYSHEDSSGVPRGFQADTTIGTMKFHDYIGDGWVVARHPSAVCCSDCAESCFLTRFAPPAAGECSAHILRTSPPFAPPSSVSFRRRPQSSRNGTAKLRW